MLNKMFYSKNYVSIELREKLIPKKKAENVYNIGEKGILQMITINI